MTPCQPKYDARTEQFVQDYLAAPYERRCIVDVMLTLLTAYKGNRDEKGRSRKVPSANQRVREYLLLIRSLQEYQTEAFQAEIDAQLELCDELDTEAARKDGSRD